MRSRFFAWFAHFLICLTIVTSLPACVSRLTVAEVLKLNNGAEFAQSCVKAPVATSDTDMWAHNMQKRRSMSNGDPGKLDGIELITGPVS